MRKCAPSLMQEGIEDESILHEVVVGGLGSRGSKTIGGWMAGGGVGGRRPGVSDARRMPDAQRRTTSKGAALEEGEGREEEKS